MLRPQLGELVEQKLLELVNFAHEVFVSTFIFIFLHKFISFCPCTNVLYFIKNLENRKTNWFDNNSKHNK